MERIRWIDFLRGIAMIGILIFHTECYYKEYHVTPYYIYTTNAIVLFYFISGFLFSRQETFSLRHKLISIVRSLLVPYFVFTPIIAIIKALIRHQEIRLEQIINGQASWFIAALIVAEIIFSLSIFITNGKLKWLSIITLGCFALYWIIPFNVYNFWQWQDALLALFFIYLGYVFYKHKQVINTFNKLLYSLLLLGFIIIIKIYEYYLDLPMRNIAIENIPLFLIDCMVWLLFVISLIKHIPSSKMIEWTGRHSIIYYFLAGGIPILVSLILNMLGFPHQNIWTLIIACVLVYLTATILVWIVYKVMPINLNKYIRI